MTSQQYGRFAAAVPDLHDTPLGSVGTCPSCRQHPLTLKPLEGGGFEPSCAGGCELRRIVAAVTRIVGAVTNGVNGEHPKEPEGISHLNRIGREKSLEELAPPKDLAPEALTGIAGRAVRLISPHTESAEVALLISFLVGVGSLIGRNPHFFIEGARHGTNLFGVMVGVSSSGRKGTATNRTEEILSSIDCNWTKNIVRGLSSGEGLTHAVRDPRIEQVPVKKSGRFTGEYDEVTVDMGVTDKRCMVREEEFASVLRVMGREGNTLSAVVRNAWDNKRLGAMTKSNRETATDPHISILGHITEVELKRHLTETEAGNGFANRFLWICTHRSKVLPRGGARPDLLPIIHDLYGTWEFAREVEEVTFDEEAGKVWDAIYEPLSDRFPGLLGSVTSRAEAQVLRLSVLYAVLDAERTIRCEHLLSALALWDFCEKSAAYLFGRATGDDYADTIEEALLETESLSRTDIRDKFGRNAPPGRIPKALANLKAEGRADFTLLQTGERGRPMELWFATDAAKTNPKVKEPGTNLERAKRAVEKLTTDTI